MGLLRYHRRQSGIQCAKRREERDSQKGVERLVVDPTAQPREGRVLYAECLLRRCRGRYSPARRLVRLPVGLLANPDPTPPRQSLFSVNRLSSYVEQYGTMIPPREQTEQRSIVKPPSSSQSPSARWRSLDRSYALQRRPHGQYDHSKSSHLLIHSIIAVHRGRRPVVE